MECGHRLSRDEVVGREDVLIQDRDRAEVAATNERGVGEKTEEIDVPLIAAERIGLRADKVGPPQHFGRACRASGIPRSCSSPSVVESSPFPNLPP